MKKVKYLTRKRPGVLIQIRLIYFIAHIKNPDKFCKPETMFMFIVFKGN